ncbi:hypothetical protein, unlikely [Trypanosoma brucei gambiense DAL972]|uniref:Uncharacterized protein n=1 Tax=Trypanosoma brucei gambiense (strain MHOM/CI/86/DAL972) TaxID=679716 RepID=D0A1L6_TRYB9|nr:hypothetical protein, unlikely [Trypanosoma brucei gambiense DAL972]CBH15158.1 hypothetical protein, unlikely [Trypanosoma brucei gambiense DAL972]|eukprot:XP_011777424.1 hypothetical protein, unlikely [Trypanosoma brucei gambiense DAL972]
MCGCIYTLCLLLESPAKPCIILFTFCPLRFVSVHFPIIISFPCSFFFSLYLFSPPPVTHPPHLFIISLSILPVVTFPSFISISISHCFSFFSFFPFVLPKNITRVGEKGKYGVVTLNE